MSIYCLCRELNEDDLANKWKPPSEGRLAELKSEKEWSRLIKDHPMTSSRRRQYATAHAVMLAGLTDGDGVGLTRTGLTCTGF